MLKLII